jgi:ketosteroid isomerase-like protein
MTRNVQAIERYMEGFRQTDRAQILACLTDDVEWIIPGAFHARGKDAFNTHIVDEGFTGQPEITVTRYIESGDVVIAEGRVVAHRTGAGPLNVVFCDVFDLREGLISRLVSYLMPLQ